MLPGHLIFHRYRIKTFDIGYDSISTLPVHSILIRYRSFEQNRVRYCIAILGYRDIEGKNFDVVHDISAMSGYKDIEVFSLIPKILFLSGTICHTWGGWAHQTRSSPAHWSSLLVLDPLGRSVLLRDCLGALSCCPTCRTPQNVQCSCRKMYNRSCRRRAHSNCTQIE